MKLFLAILLLLLVGCSKEPSTFIPAPRSLDTLDAVKQDAAKWTQSDPANRYWTNILPTGSMEPFINEHSLVLCVRYRGQAIPNGSVVIYNRGDVPRVIHVVSDQNVDSVYMSGYANHTSDGWQPKSAIEGVMIGQLYGP